MAWEKQLHICPGTSIIGFLPVGLSEVGIGSIHVCDDCGQRRLLTGRYGAMQLPIWRVLSAEEEKLHPSPTLVEGLAKAIYAGTVPGGRHWNEDSAHTRGVYLRHAESALAFLATKRLLKEMRNDDQGDHSS